MAYKIIVVHGKLLFTFHLKHYSFWPPADANDLVTALPLQCLYALSMSTLLSARVSLWILKSVQYPHTILKFQILLEVRKYNLGPVQ